MIHLTKLIANLCIAN